MISRIGTTFTLALALSLGTMAQRSTTSTPPAESQLVGVKLFDTGIRVLNMFGSPETIEPIAIGGGQGPGGGATGPGPSGDAGGPVQGGAGGMGAPPPGENMGPRRSGGLSITDYDGLIGNPFGFPTSARQQGGPQLGGPGMGDDSQGPAKGGGGGGLNMPGGTPGPGAGAGGGVSGTTSVVTFTRWGYRRGSSRYAFVLDRFNRVVQIEAVGLSDARARTSRGVSFGSTFSQVMQKYGNPDGYEISADNILIRYLVKSKVAFRLSRLAPGRPHQVTGIVVSAGK